MKIKNKQTSFKWYLIYFYIPTFIFLISRIFIKEFDPVFTLEFFTVITVSFVMSYYLTNKSFGKIDSEKLIGMTIPIGFLISLVFAILLNVLA